MKKGFVLPRLTRECELGPWTGRGEDDICEKLKTLKDIEGIDPHFEEDTGDYVFNGDIKAEAVKWVKEDLKEMPITPQTSWLLNRWMKRFDITEEDLK